MTEDYEDVAEANAITEAAEADFFKTVALSADDIGKIRTFKIFREEGKKIFTI